MPMLEYVNCNGTELIVSISVPSVPVSRHKFTHLHEKSKRILTYRVKGLKVALLGLSTAQPSVLLALKEFPHSSPDASRTTQARETSTSVGGN
jgi:hypothetical protein